MNYLSRQHIKKQRYYFFNKGPSSQGYGFPSSHVWMWELDYKEIWALKNCCFWTVVLEKTLESHLDCKEIQPVHPKGDQSWVFTGRTDVEAETSALWPLMWRTDLLEKTWFWERLKVGDKGDDRGWGGWMASLIQWTWVWVNSGSWWWTGRPGMLHSMGLQRVGHNWVTELNWFYYKYIPNIPWHILTLMFFIAAIDWNFKFNCASFILSGNPALAAFGSYRALELGRRGRKEKNVLCNWAQDTKSFPLD